MSLFAFLLAAATAATEPPRATASLEAAVRAQAVAIYAEDCGGRIVVPAWAFIPLSIRTGLGPPVALALGRVDCPNYHRFHGTGGALVQVWAGTAAQPALVLEEMMFGFAIEDGQLVAWQHGARCENGGGPDICRVTFLYDPRVGRLVPVSRVLESGTLDEIIVRHRMIVTDS